MRSHMHDAQGQKIAVIGNYLPRQCGIATYTTDFCEALAATSPRQNVIAVAVTDTTEGYAYPARVHFEMVEDDLASYRRAADFLNTSDVDLVVLQHEYGIFGGSAGHFILALLRDLQMPIVTVLHTVLRAPDQHQRRALVEIAGLSDRLIIMSEHARGLLHDVYAIPADKINFIPHGIPDIPFVDPNFYKDRFDAEGKMVLLTFGLLSPNKGIEHVISALPAIVERFPDIVYLILGTTHPHVKQHEGEGYRLMLQQLARDLGVERHVAFYNQFVQLEQLVEFIGAADIYITPYLNPDQIVSGTLAYTVGAGKAVISTPYAHAEELLADGRGLLVPFRDPPAIARAVIQLLDSPADRHAMRKRAYQLGREMTWPTVAQRYLDLFRQVHEERARAPRFAIARAAGAWPPQELPPLSLAHLRRMTDTTGLLQHATFSVPNFGEGYSTDDNARALIAMVLLEELELDAVDPESGGEVAELAARYLSLLRHAFNAEAGRFRNMLAYDRRWLETVGSEDSHARTLWSLGTVLGRSANEGLAGVASHLFRRALPAALDFSSPRAWAFTLLGLTEYLKRFTGDLVAQRARDELASRLMQAYAAHSTSEWPWFEDILAYDNATLPRALLLAGRGMGRSVYVKTALTALTWLRDLQRGENGQFVPIGCQGWYPRGATRARFDQQPIEAYATVAAYLDAYRVLGQTEWLRQAQVTFEWFLGRNDLGLPLIDPATGACYDGLQPDGVNQNRGAESTLAFLLARLDLRQVVKAASADPDQASAPNSSAEAHVQVPG